MVDERNAATAAKQQQQQELQKKILSILNGSDGAGPPPVVAPSSVAPSPQLLYGVSAPALAGGRGIGGVPLAVAAPPPAPTTAINFDNPNVQAALDTLISSGSNLLKNINAVTSTPSAVGYRAQVAAPAPTAPPLGVSKPVGYGGYMSAATMPPRGPYGY